MSKLSSLKLLESYMEDLSSIIEESNRLQEIGESSKDNDYELKKSLFKIKKFLERNDDGKDFDELVQQYENNLDIIKNLDKNEFTYERNVIPKVLQSKKSVRFNELIETSESINFKPYKDNVIELPSKKQSIDLFESAKNNEINKIDNNMSNHELFIQHQQQLIHQDEHLQSLSQSVRRQHELSLNINDELQDQNIMLDDLENQLDSSQKNLNNGQKRLNYFSKKVKENGQWLIIIVLIIILVLLLIILK